MHPTATHPTPAPEHARLAAMVGTWDVQLTFWEKPGEPPMKSRGFAVVEPLFGGLFIQERIEGLIGEDPFVTLSWTGYDPATKRFQASRIASGGAALSTDTGSFDERQRALIFEGNGGQAGGRLRRILTQPSPDALVLECLQVPVIGAPWRSCEIRYTRRNP